MGPWIATAIVIGTVIGSGIFKKPQVIAKSVEEFIPVIFIWCLGAVIVILGALSLSEVAVKCPQTGGNYAFLKNGYGRWAGFLWGWVEFWVIRSSSIGALASIFVDSMNDLLHSLLQYDSSLEVISFWPRQMLSIGLVGLLTWVNIRGTRWSGSLQLFITILKIITLLGLIFLPLIWILFRWHVTSKPDWNHLEPILPNRFSDLDLSKMGAAFVGVWWAYHGWMNIAPVAGEVKNPNRNLPLALILGTVIVSFIYISINISYRSVISNEQLTTLTNRTVAGAFFEEILGPLGLFIASGLIMLSVFGSLNGNILVGPRVLYAMGQDDLAPRVLGNLHGKYQTPAVAILAFSLWTMVLIISIGLITVYRIPTFALFGWRIDLNVPPGKSLFDIITDFAMFGSLSFETFAVSTIFVFRKKIENDHYRCPFYPWIPIIYISVVLLVLLNMFIQQRTEAVFGCLFILIGAIVYRLFYYKK